MTVKSNIKKTFFYQFLVARLHQRSVKRNPRKEMNRYYRQVFGRDADFEKPIDLIEKIYWLQLNTDTSLWSKCADKYAMREYVKDCGFDNYLPQHYGHWVSAKDIDFQTLPNEFVLKSNNGCGTVLIVRDKKDIDEKSTKRKLDRWLKIPFGWSGAQLHYTRIEPCLLAEELLQQDEEQKTYSPNSQVDYKVWCINGNPECVLIVFNRDSEGYSLDLYDTQWCRLNKCLKKNGHYKTRSEPIPKPKCLDEMLAIAKKMAQPFPEVRVDFYVVGGKPVIGELTFTTGFGYFTDEYYEYLGKKMIIKELR